MSNKNTFSHNHLTSEQIKLLLQDLIQKQTKLNKIHADLLDSMEKHGIDKKRFTEYFTIEPDEMTNYTFEQNIAAVFVKDVLVKEEFCPKIQDVINNIVATRSPEGLKTFVLSTEQLSKLSQDSGMSVSDAKELFLKYVDDIKSPFWDTCREEMKKIQTEFPYIRGDFDRGVLEYCQDGDMDYIFSVDRSIAEDEPKIYTALVEDYSNMKKTESTDEILELILKLLPVLYTNAPSLFSLHRNPEKAKNELGWKATKTLKDMFDRYKWLSPKHIKDQLSGISINDVKIEDLPMMTTEDLVKELQYIKSPESKADILKERFNTPLRPYVDPLLKK